MRLLRDKDKRNQLRADLYEKLDHSGESIPQTIKTLRKILAKDQAEFSEYVGISLATLRKIEQSGGGVTVATLKKIFDKFSLELVVRRKKRGDGTS